MKRLLAFVFCAIFSASLFADDNELTSEQRKLRTDIVQYLRTEGMDPDVDTNGHIQFWKGEEAISVIVDHTERNPMFVTIAEYYKYPRKHGRETVERYANETNLWKGIKIVFYDKVYAIQAEMFLRTSSTFTTAYPKLIDQIREARMELDRYLSGGSETPAKEAAPKEEAVTGNQGSSSGPFFKLSSTDARAKLFNKVILGKTTVKELAENSAYRTLDATTFAYKNGIFADKNNDGIIDHYKITKKEMFTPLFGAYGFNWNKLSFDNCSTFLRELGFNEIFNDDSQKRFSTQDKKFTITVYESGYMEVDFRIK